MLVFLLSVADERDRSKVEEIYRKYHDVMYKAALGKLYQKPNAVSLAEDAVQNAFIKIIEHFDSIRFDEGEKRLRNYFVYIAVHEALNLFNQKESFSLSDHEMEDLPSDEDFEKRICARESFEDIQQAILRLEDRYKIILYLYFIEEKNGNEIAALLDMNRSTVHTNIQRGKAMLLKLLKERYKDDQESK